MLDILKGFFYPIFSHKFYQRVITFSTWKTIFFVIIFTFTISLFSTLITTIIIIPRAISIASEKETIVQDVQNFIKEKNFTRISLKNEKFSTDLRPQPYIYTNKAENFQLIIDTHNTFNPNSYKQKKQFILITKDQVTMQQKKGSSYKSNTFYWADVKSDGFVITKKELISNIAPWIDTFFTWGWVFIALFLLIILPIFKMIVLSLKLALFTLLFSIIIYLILPKHITKQRGTVAFKLSIFLFVPIFYIASVISFFISLLPIGIAVFFTIFKLLWFPFALFWLEFIAKRSSLTTNELLPNSERS